MKTLILTLTLASVLFAGQCRTIAIAKSNKGDVFYYAAPEMGGPKGYVVGRLVEECNDKYIVEKIDGTTLRVPKNWLIEHGPTYEEYNKLYQKSKENNSGN